jgi:predicted AAA+ superfamily ATPase
MSILNCVQLEGELVKLDNEMIPSLKLLSKDQKFRDTLQKIKKNFYINFCNYYVFLTKTGRITFENS